MFDGDCGGFDILSMNCCILKFLVYGFMLHCGCALASPPWCLGVRGLVLQPALSEEHENPSCCSLY